MFSLSICPTFLCNLRCEFCYLTHSQLSDSATVSISAIERRLEEVTEHTQIDHVDVYGGEISLLPLEYQAALYETIRKYNTGTLNVVTNFTKLSPIFELPGVSVSVSYDFDARTSNHVTFQNIADCQYPVSILMLASPKLMENNVDDMIRTFNALPAVTSVEIKPYSANQSNSLPVNFTDYENFIRTWLGSSVKKNFKFINEESMRDSVLGLANSFSDDHVYILPSGKFGVLEFDANNKEYFKPLNSFNDYITWTLDERERVTANEHCFRCKYYGSCLSEHLQEVTNVEHSCNGFVKLLDWYSDEIRA